MPAPVQKFDVIVVGCGIAGLSAAVAAQQNGAHVCVLERSPAEERGGNTRYTGAYIRMKSTDAVSDDFIEHFGRNGGGYIDPSLLHGLAGPAATWSAMLRSLSFVDPEVVSTLAEEAPPTLHWLEGFGIRFVALEIPFPTTTQPRIVPTGGGLAMIEALAARFEADGGNILYEVSAQSLIQDDDGAVAGVSALAPGSRPLRLYGKVILASGGFQGNAEMMTRYIGPRAIYLRAMSRGCHYNKGEGIRMALDIGAAPCGDFGSWHASPFDPRSSRPGASLYIYPYGILVNKLGRRFTDEAPGATDETYESVTRAIHAQPDGMAWTILDASLADVPNQQVAIRTEQPAIEAKTLEALAGKLDIVPARLRETADAYNHACRPGRFDPRALDGLCTEGLFPEKSNWARPLDAPPFRAYPIVSSIVFSFGGLKCNTRGQVVSQQGEPISGLYAAGETMGLYYGSYTGATSVLKGAVFGRLAGIDAAAAARGSN